MKKIVKAIRVNGKQIDLPYSMEIDMNKQIAIQVIEDLIKNYEKIKNENDELAMEKQHRFVSLNSF